MTSVFAKIMYRLLAVLMSLYTVTGGIAAPSSADPIKSLDASSVKLTAVFMGDTQVSDYMLSRQLYLKNTCLDIASSEEQIDALIHVGDVAENGKAAEYKLIAEDYSVIDNVDNYLFAVGNHDVRLRAYCQVVNTFTEFANTVDKNNAIDRLWYTREINGYTFIVMGTTRTEFEESYFSDEELNWLDENLAAATANGKPAFVICHQPLKLTHGLPDTWGSPIDSAGSVGAQSDDIAAILTKYENVFFLTGHLHTGFGKYSYEDLGSVHLINTPSIGIKNADGLEARGTGFMIEVYEDTVVFRARNFAEGVYLPEYDMTYSLI